VEWNVQIDHSSPVLSPYCGAHLCVEGLIQQLAKT